MKHDSESASGAAFRRTLCACLAVSAVCFTARSAKDARRSARNTSLKTSNCTAAQSAICYHPTLHKSYSTSPRSGRLLIARQFTAGMERSGNLVREAGRLKAVARYRLSQSSVSRTSSRTFSRPSDESLGYCQSSAGADLIQTSHCAIPYRSASAYTDPSEFISTLRSFSCCFSSASDGRNQRSGNLLK